MIKVLKFPLILLLVLFVIGCSANENGNEETNGDTANNQIETPVIEGLEFSHSEDLGPHRTFYYDTNLDSDEAKNLVEIWAVSEGFVRTEEIAGAINMEKSGLTYSMAIMAYNNSESDEHDIRVQLNYPLR